jgi:hypothetical protein
MKKLDQGSGEKDQSPLIQDTGTGLVENIPSQKSPDIFYKDIKTFNQGLKLYYFESDKVNIRI